MCGYRIGGTPRGGKPRYLYLDRPPAGLWNGDALAEQPEWIICDTILGAFALWCHGVHNVTALHNLSALTGEHLALVRKIHPRKVFLACRNAPDGDRVANEAAVALVAEGIRVYRLALLRGKDVADQVRLLADEDPASVLSTLQNLLASAPLVQPAEPLSKTMTVRDKDLDGDLQEEASPEACASAVQPVASPEEPLQTDASRSVDAHGERNNDDIAIRCGDRHYRIRGLAKNLSFDLMRVNIRVTGGRVPAASAERDGSARGPYHIDTLDLYNARHRTAFTNTAAQELGVAPGIIKNDLGKVLLGLEELQDAQIREALSPKADPVPTMNDEERDAAMDLLTDPKLLKRIADDFTTCGLVGEETNKLVGYLAAVSRKLDDPLAVLVQSTSAAGKSRLLEAVLAFTPEEDRVKYSAMTGQALFYLGDVNIKHKVLAIVEEEGAERASFALKLLQSEGELTIASTGKHPDTGRMVTQEYRVEGPVMILTTTAAIDIEEELLNRCIVLTVDESREQTKAIHKIQREAETLDGMLRRLGKDTILKTHRNAQRLLRPLQVVNPYARQLTFLDDRTRTRRDHTKYLTLIRAIALLHQHQRPVKAVQHGGQPVELIEVTPSDIAVANRLAGEVLGRTLDELPPQTRRFLDLLTEIVNRECEEHRIERPDFRFTQRAVREHTGWTSSQVKRHMRKLVELEYVLTHRGGRGQSFVYELLYNGEGAQGSPFLMGLIDVATLRPESKYDDNRDGLHGDRDGSEREWDTPGTPQVPPGDTPGTPPGTECKSITASDVGHAGTVCPENAQGGAISRPGKASYCKSPPQATVHG
jgi:hypothetical protein